MRKPWTRLFEVPWIYRAWQAPFHERKLAPLVAHNDMQAIRRALDVGCGPGTNARHFRGKDYLGLDINPEYVAQARARYAMRFEVADVTRWQARDGLFDFILVNSLLHHLPDEGCDRILTHLATLLTDDGMIHVLELVLPPTASPARLLARLDRGDYPRPLGAWEELLQRYFVPDVVEPFDLGVAGVALWKMVYFRGRSRTAGPGRGVAQ